MKLKLSSLFVIAFVCLCCLTDQVTPQATKDVDDIEYQVYSAYINQTYLARFNNVWFTINGAESRSFEHLDRIGEVVIYTLVIPETTNGYSRFAHIPYRSEISGEIFNDFLNRNKDYYVLSDKFKVNVKHSLISQDDLISLSKEAEVKKTSYGALFLKRFPKAVGAVGFFRVGFSQTKTKALLGTSIGYFYKTKTDVWGSVQQLVLLSKHSGAWKVDKVFPQNKPLKVNLKDCQKNSIHKYLPLGSTAFTVIGKEKSKCHVQEFYEEEGGYSKTDCLIPSRLNELLVSGVNPFIYSLDISKYCEKPKSGNIFFDQFDLSTKPE